MVFTDQKSIQQTRDEIHVLVRLQSAFVVRYFDAWTESVEEARPAETTDYFQEHSNMTFGDLLSDSYEYVVEEGEEAQEEASESLQSVSAESGPESAQNAPNAQTVTCSVTEQNMLNNTLFIQMELCKGKTLFDLIYNTSPGNDQMNMSDDFRLKLTIQLINGL